MFIYLFECFSSSLFFLFSFARYCYKYGTALMTFLCTPGADRVVFAQPDDWRHRMVSKEDDSCHN